MQVYKVLQDWEEGTGVSAAIYGKSSTIEPIRIRTNLYSCPIKNPYQVDPVGRALMR